MERFWLIVESVVISIVRIVPPKQRRLEVLEILRSVVGPTETRAGCLSCCIYQEDGPDQATLLYARWETEAALREYIRSELYRRVLAACEFSNLPPDFDFHDIRRTRGMELIYQVRGCEGEQFYRSLGV